MINVALLVAENLIFKDITREDMTLILLLVWISSKLKLNHHLHSDHLDVVDHNEVLDELAQDDTVVEFEL